MREDSTVYDNIAYYIVIFEGFAADVNRVEAGIGQLLQNEQDKGVT
jgi:hypothetical protein